MLGCLGHLYLQCGVVYCVSRGRGLIAWREEDLRWSEFYWDVQKAQEYSYACMRSVVIVQSGEAICTVRGSGAEVADHYRS